jgi:hypothetical protein
LIWLRAFVMAGLVPAIHVFAAVAVCKELLPRSAVFSA